MANYSQFQLEQNRRSGQTTQQIIRSLFIGIEVSVKFIFNFVGEMIKMVMGK